MRVAARDTPHRAQRAVPSPPLSSGGTVVIPSSLTNERGISDVRYSEMNPTRLCEPSQNGLVWLCPQRHSQHFAPAT